MDSEVMALVKHTRSDLAKMRRRMQHAELLMEKLSQLLSERDAEVVHLRAEIGRMRQQLNELQDDTAYRPEEVVTAKIRITASDRLEVVESPSP